MHAVKATGTIDKRGQLMLDQPLDLAENSRVEVIVLVEYSAVSQDESLIADDTPNEEILTDLRQAWHEAMTGQTIPIAQLWNELENE
ncbi:MAG: hypothetical protein AAGE59_07615 [Cyanobacteria bacterium P01_F01_bin.86]